MEKNAVRSGAFARRRRDAALPLLFVAGFCAYGCNHGSMIYTPLLVLDGGGDLFAVGLQATVFLALAVALRFWLGPLADRRGTKPLMALGLAAYAVTTPLLGLCGTFAAVLVIRCVQAVGMAAFFPCALSAVSEVAGQRNSGLTLGAYRLVSSVALTVSAAALFPLVQSIGYAGTFTVMGAVGALGLLCVLAAPVPGTAQRDAERGAEDDSSRNPGLLSQLRQILAAHRLLAASVLGATFVAALGYGLVTNFATPFVEKAAPTVNAGVLVALVGVGGLVANPVAGWLVDRRDSFSTLAFFLGCLGAGVAALALVPAAPAGMPLVGLAVGVGYFGVATSAVALIAKRIAPEGRSSFIAMQQNCIDVGAGLAGIFFGTLFSFASPAVGFVLWGVVTMAVGIAILYAATDAKRRAHRV